MSLSLRQIVTRHACSPFLSYGRHCPFMNDMRFSPVLLLLSHFFSLPVFYLERFTCVNRFLFVGTIYAFSVCERSQLLFFSLLFPVEFTLPAIPLVSAITLRHIRIGRDLSSFFFFFLLHPIATPTPPTPTCSVLLFTRSHPLSPIYPRFFGPPPHYVEQVAAPFSSLTRRLSRCRFFFISPEELIGSPGLQLSASFPPSIF